MGVPKVEIVGPAPALDRSPIANANQGESGVTLVELVVSIAILGVLLTAVASSLISSTRSASISERRVAATAALSELHEEFQSIPFELAGNFEDELPELSDLGDRFAYDPIAAADEFEFDGREGVVVGLDCTETDEAADLCRRRVPEARILQGEMGERDAYRFYQVVTWVDRSGDGDPDTKRLTTIAEWEWLGETRSETFESERTLDDVETPTEPGPSLVVSAPAFAGIDLEPNTGNLDAGDLADDIPVSVNFNVSGITDVEVSVTTLTVTAGDPPTFGPGTEPATFFFTDQVVDGESVTFTGDILSGTGPFEVGSLVISAQGTLPGGATITGQRSIQLFDADSSDATFGPVGVSSPLASPSPIRVQNTKFSCPLTVSAFVTGLTADDYSVSAVYTGTGGGFNDTVTLLPVGGESNISPSGTTFQQVFGTASNHGFSGSGSTTHSGTFMITATRSAGGSEDSAQAATSSVTFVYSGNPPC